MRKCFSMLLGAGMIALLTSCNFVASPNNGDLAQARLDQYVDWSNGTGGDSSGGGGGGSGDSAIFTDCFIWEADKGIMQGVKVEFSDSAITCWNEGSDTWFGIAFGRIENGKYTTVDMSEVKKVEFTVSSTVSSSYTIKICDQKIVKTYTSSPNPKTETISLDDGDYSSVDEVFVVVVENKDFKDSESALKITGIKFLDKNGKQLTTLPTKAK